MDTLTHGLAGALLARALPGTGDETLDGAFARREAWLGFCAAMFPDADALVSPFSAEFYITQHRALTHSFPLLPLWALVLAAAASLRPPRRRGPRRQSGAPRSSGRASRSSPASRVLSHILMDWITSWGTMFLSPFDWSRYTLDWVFILDAALSGLLVLGLAGMWAVARAALPSALARGRARRPRSRRPRTSSSAG